jgi:LysM repeat protein
MSTNIVSGFTNPNNTVNISSFSQEELAQFTPTDSSGNGFLVKPSLQTADGKRTGVSDILLYTVKSGDTISNIAARFNISSDTILAANGLTSRNILKEGKTLIILPVDGLLYKVQKDDTIEKIAQKYNIDKTLIIAQNNLQNTTVSEGKGIIIPGAKRIILDPIATNTSPSNKRYASVFFDSSVKGTTTKDAKGYTGSILSRFASNCVLAERQKNPNLPMGLFTLRQKEAQIQGHTPKPGATVVTSEGGYTGHVAHVEKVESDRIFVSECNYQHGKCTTRWIDKNSPVIKGYIY